MHTLPTEFRHNYLAPNLGESNLVFMDSKSVKPLDTCSRYHTGPGLPDKVAIVESCFRVEANGVPIVKPPRIAWRSTRLHRSWLHDPTGHGIVAYASLTLEKLAARQQMRRRLLCFPALGQELPADV